MKVVLSGALYQQILDHARSRPDLEVCGLLGAVAGAIKSYYPVDNIADQPQQAFLMDPAGQLRAMRSMREHGETMAGIFHSHPLTAARPSLRDRREARYANVYYFIASLQHPDPDLNCFLFDGRDFHAVPLSVDMQDHRCQNPDSCPGGKP